MNYSTIVVAFIAALAGTIVGPLVKAWIDRGQRSDEWSRADWEGRQAAYIELLQILAKVVAGADSAMTSGGVFPTTEEEADALHLAEVAVELRASPDAWTEMEPYVRAVSLCGNAVFPRVDQGTRQEIARELKEIGGDTAEGRDELRKRFTAAVRRDLGPEPPRRR